MFRGLVVWTVLSLVMGVCVGPSLAQDDEAAPPKFERTKEQAGADARALQELYQEHAEAFRGVGGGVSVGETTEEGTLKRCETELPTLQALEQNATLEMEPVLARVMDLWSNPGAEDEARAEEGFDEAEFAFQHAGTIEWNMKMTAADNDVSAARELPEEFSGLSSRYSNLARMLHNVRKTRVANGEYLANHVRNMPEITFFVQEKRVAIMTGWKNFLQWSLKFDQANEYANTRLAKIDAEIAALQKAVEKEMDEKAWAGQMEGFPGPGTAAGLSQLAVDYFRKHKGWGNKGDDPEKNEDGTVKPGVEIVAVAVRGPWQVAETDIFGRVISWRLPIHLAITKPDLKAKNIARVYELSFVTAQGAPGRVAKGAPFAGYWVGNSWMMRLSKIPRAQ